MDAKRMNGGGPLEGCRVLELGSIIAGPFCGRLLADFGAEVIKIEPLDGDGLRLTGKRYKGKSRDPSPDSRPNQRQEGGARRPC